MAQYDDADKLGSALLRRRDIEEFKSNFYTWEIEDRKRISDLEKTVWVLIASQALAGIAIVALILKVFYGDS